MECKEIQGKLREFKQFKGIQGNPMESKGIDNGIQGNLREYDRIS